MASGIMSIYGCFVLGLSLAMDAPKVSQETLLQASEKLRDILKEEKAEKGSFIKKIVADLKNCTSGKMVELSFLTLKSAYWWDESPKEGRKFNPQDFNSKNKKILSIDHKFRSSIYDREEPFYICSHNIKPIKNGDYICKKERLVNSWKSAQQKNIFYNKFSYEDKSHKLPEHLKGILAYGAPINIYTDTYPSIFQIMRALKTDKYKEKEACSFASKEIEKQPASMAILTEVNTLLDSGFYQRFVKQNHPLNKIIQDHLRKIKYKAKKKKFKSDRDNPSENYNRSIIYHKIIANMGILIELMSVFDIDMDLQTCDLPNVIDWQDTKPEDAYYLYVQLYEVFNDLLFLLLSLDDPYQVADFDAILTQNFVNRFPLFADLNKNDNILIASYPMRSGMDAFMNASMAIGHAPQDFSLAPKALGLTNSVYFQIDILLKSFKYNREKKLFASLRYSPPVKEMNIIRKSFIEAYAQDQVENRIIQEDNKKSFIDDFMKEDDLEKVLPLSNLDGETYLEIPLFMVDYLKTKNDSEMLRAKTVLSLLSSSIGGLIHNHFVIDKYLSLTTGMTADTALPGNNQVFIEDLYRRINQIIKTKNEWNIHDDKIDLCLNIINDIKTKYAYLDNENLGHILDSIESDVVAPYLTKLDTLGNNILVLPNDLLRDFMTELTGELNSRLLDVRMKLTYNPLEAYEGIEKYTPDPFVLLWDITLETNEGPCYQMMDKFRQEIESGRVVFVLFKSLQKYANLGIGKSKAGMVMLVGKKSPFVEKIHKKLTEYGNDVFLQHQDYALITFFYDRFEEGTNRVLFQDNEVLYHKAIKQHANRILAQSMAVKNDNSYTATDGFLFNERPYEGAYCDPNISFAGTFGFAIPTKAYIGDFICRYSVGLNPRGLY